MTIDDNEDLSTANDILESIGEGSNEDDALQSSETTEEGTGSQTTGTQQSKDTTDGQAPGTGTQEQQAGKPTIGPQDLVGKDGTLIAQGGKERRFYEAAQSSKREVANLTRQLDEVNIRIKAFEDSSTVGKQYDLTPEEVTTGVQLMSSYKKDPIGTIKYMLTEAQASGHNIDDLGTTDMSSMKKMFEDVMKPFADQRQAELDTQENTAQAQEHYNSFMGKYPDAAVHEDTIAQLLNEDSSLSPDAAYFKLQSYYASRGLDWTKSLAMLKEVAANKPSETQNTQQALPDGNNVAPNRVTDSPDIADISTSLDDIIRQSMVEAGIN